MSFMLTTRQLLDGSKTVTRRVGWRFLRPGDRLRAVERAMGLRKGERVVVLAELEVVSVRVERLDAITAEDCVAEGFPELGPAGFVAMFLEHVNRKRSKAERAEGGLEVTRVEFRKVSRIGETGGAGVDV